MTEPSVSRMRIAIVVPPFYEVPPQAYGGTERVCYFLVEGLVERGHDVTLIAAGNNHTRARYVATFPAAQPEGTENDTEVEIVHAARAAAILTDLPADIVHDHTRAGPLTSASRAVPTVVTVHSAVAGPDSHAEALDVLGRWVRFVAISNTQRSAAPHLNWTATVYNGIPVREYPFCAEKSDYILYLGRLSPHKGVHLAIEAAQAAGRRLIIAGAATIPAEEDYIHQEIRPRLGPGIDWVGEVRTAEKKELLAGAACLIYPIRWQEPFGLAMVEAMACGTPVVGLRAGSLPELVVDGVTGVVCDALSDLPGAIDRVTHLDPKDCRAHVSQAFSAERMVEGYEAVYRRLLSRM